MKNEVSRVDEEVDEEEADEEEVDKDHRVPVRIGHQEDDTYFC